MNKRAVIIILIIIALIIGGVAYLLVSEDTGKTVREDSRKQTTQVQPKDYGDKPAETSPPLAAGKYIEYKDGVIAETTGTKLLFFHAPWCPQCRALEADIQDKGVPEGVAIIKVDYDSSQQLRQKYGVTVQTTVIRVDDNGNLVEKFVAYDDPSMAAVAKELL